MTVTEIVQGKKGKLTVCLDTGISFPIYEREASGYHLKEGAELSKEQWSEIRTEILDKRAKKRAMYLLQKMDRTEYQLRQKLRENGYPEEVIECAVTYVKSYHYIDDLRYASAYISYHQNQKSRLQLKVSLQQKGISPEVIACAMVESYTGEEEPLILKMLEKKHYDPAGMEQKEKHKIYQYLMRKGFSGEAVRRCMEL